MEQLMKDTIICSNDIIRAFISRRVLPLQRRSHKISQMCGPRDPTKITGLPLSKEDVVLKAKERFPRIAAEERGPCRKRDLDEVGQEFLEKLASQGKKNKAPAPDAGPSQAPPAKRSRQEVVGGKKVSSKHYQKKRMLISKSATGMRPESSEEAARTSPPPQPSPALSGAGNLSASPLGGTTSAGRTAPEPSEDRAEEDTDAPEAPSPPKTAPAPPAAASTGEPAAAKPTPPPSQEPVAAKPTAPEGIELSKQDAVAVATAASSFSSGPQSLVLHTGRAAVVAGETASAQLGRITELTRGGADLGHLLDYAEKWNQADLSPATHGLGKDKMPAIDPAGPRSTGQHFSRLRRAVKEFDNAWHDATNNVVLFWKPPSRPSKLSSPLFKEQLSAEHHKVKSLVGELKEKLIQDEGRHARERKEAKAAAEAKLDETLKECADSTAVLWAELEEESGARKVAQDRIALLDAEQKEYDRLVVQTDVLALMLFPDSQAHAHNKVAERRVAQEMSNPDAPWDPYDHLVALSARIQHMRAVDRHLVDLPDRTMEIFKDLWPEEAVPVNVTLISDRLRDACRRIREWKCSTARAGARAALRVACSWYEDLDLDAFHSLRGDAPTDMDLALTAKRQDRAYRIAECASTRTFIPPPPDVKDALSDDEEEVEDEEDEEAGEGEVPPEAPGAGDAPPEAPVA
nr:uncharacterized protein LOC127332146 [Lolium perenne]